MSNSEYLQTLFAGFWAYCDHQFGSADYYDRPFSQNLRRPPVFRPGHADKNVLLPLGIGPSEQAAVLQTLARGKRHRHFASMRSSQALAQSVFGNLKVARRLDCLLDLKDENGLSLFPIADANDVSLEHPIGYLGENEKAPTSVDVMFAGRYRVAVECKFTEEKFGACSRPELDKEDAHYLTDFCDGTYTVQGNREKRCSLTSKGIRYWDFAPQLTGWAVDLDHDPCPLRSTYQLYRNLLAACVNPASSPSFDFAHGHAVVVFDARNPSFAADGPARGVFSLLKRSLKDPSRLRECSWQQITAAMRKDPELQWLTDSLKEKYGF